MNFIITTAMTEKHDIICLMIDGERDKNMKHARKNGEERKTFSRQNETKRNLRVQNCDDDF